MGDVRLPSGGTVHTIRVSELPDAEFMYYLREFLRDAIRRKVNVKAVKKLVKREIETTTKSDRKAE